MIGAEIWRPVMERAGYRCECRGTCGKTHSGERCDVYHSDQHRLSAVALAELDVWTNPLGRRYVRLGLWAVCPACYERARQLVRQREENDQQEGLF